MTNLTINGKVHNVPLFWVLRKWIGVTGTSLAITAVLMIVSDLSAETHGSEPRGSGNAEEHSRIDVQGGHILQAATIAGSSIWLRLVQQKTIFGFCLHAAPTRD